jgi:8-oxo-dGTP diphosphatase
MFCSHCGQPLPSRPPVTCPSCGTSHWTNPKPCAGALVVHEARLLLVRRSREPWLHHWDIPGGFCNANEHPSAAAEREVYEETGITVRTTGLLGIWMDVYDRQGEDEESTMNIYYHAIAVAGVNTPRIDPREVESTEWFAADDLPSAIAFPHHGNAVLDAWRNHTHRHDRSPL